MREIELLSPAKDLACGIAAVNHGADAVYIGAAQFGARASAGNTIGDIEKLTEYAHQFRTKIYVTLNTLLTDEQLPEAEKMIRQIYEAGADALIVQDMGILKMNIPPIALHASTQTDNRSIEKVKFLHDAGFSRVVLARELSRDEIAEIHAAVDVELEAFVHGALCVSYSGQCYISEASCGRSANRGACAQFCRLPYDLLDAEKNILIANKHLLSLKDLNLSGSLADMINAGVTSFKIEGRLKDENYVKNVTAFYRKRLDDILNGYEEIRKASSGKTTFFFEPNPQKSFNRGSSEYFFKDRQKGLIQRDTPKSLGEEIGPVSYIGGKFFETGGNATIHNGDGLCYFDSAGNLEGFRVNSVEQKRIFPAEMPSITKGRILYRNHDAAFEKVLSGKTSERKIGVDIVLSEQAGGFTLQLTDEEGICVQQAFEYEKQPANNPEGALEQIKKQLSKLGSTIYEAQSIGVDLQQGYFFPASVLNDWRRQATDLLHEKRKELYRRPAREERHTDTPYPQQELDYRGNVTNRSARSFYTEHGVEKMEPGFEIKPLKDVPVMFCKYCIKYEMGWCRKEKSDETVKRSYPEEPLFLRNNSSLYRLEFDCKECMMKVYF